jgi:predicted transcriptional regulator
LKPKRTPYEIVWQVLDFCREPKKFSHIIQSCNLNTDSANRYLELLVSKKMLEHNEDLYRTTPEGFRYVELIEKIYFRIFQ